MHVESMNLPVVPRPAEMGDRLEARVERVLAEYLRVWGLRDPSTIAAHCRLWVRQAPEDQASGQGPDRPGDRLCRAALSEAMLDIDRWLNHVTLLASENAADAPWRRGLIAVELQSLIDQYPESLLEYESLPASMLERLRRAARPVVPTPQPTRMVGQPLGELAPALQPRWWRRAFGNLAAALSSALRPRWES